MSIPNDQRRVVVDDGRDHDEEQETDVPPAVEKIAAREEQEVLNAVVPLEQSVETEHHHEEDQKLDGVEEHLAVPLHHVRTTFERIRDEGLDFRGERVVGGAVHVKVVDGELCAHASINRQDRVAVEDVHTGLVESPQPCIDVGDRRQRVA
jgi:hypothetical protein